MNVKEESEKVGLKLNIQKMKIMACGPITSVQIDGETMETVTDLIFSDSKISADGDCKVKVKMKVKLLSRVQLFTTPQTVAHQAPPSREFSRQEYWSGLPFPSPGDLPDPEIKPRFPT